jgi:TRAP-type C4-dicarboxylate transport system permease small subunit
VNPEWLTTSARIVSRINSGFLVLSGILAGLIMLVILQDVVRRYLFNDPSAWVLDICSFMLVYLVFLALAPALEAGSHVSVDLFNQLLPRRWRRGIFLFGGVLTIFFATVLFKMLLDETIEAFADDNIFPAATIAMKMKYIWMIGPAGVAQFILTAFVLLAGSIYQQDNC